MASLPTPKCLPGDSKAMCKAKYPAYRIRNTEYLNQQAEAANAVTDVTLNQFYQKVLAVCGGKLLDGPAPGMTDEVFRTCTRMARFGIPANIIDTTDDGIPLRLYVYNSNNWMRIYVANHIITEIVTQSSDPNNAMQPQAGQLQAVGSYPQQVYAPRLVSLGNGDYFAYERDPEDRWNTPEGQLERDLANPTNRSGAVLPQMPMQWDHLRQGWIKLSRAPECPGAASFYTMTVLPDRRVLLAGGLCDIARMVTDKTPLSEYRGLSMWNPDKQVWEHAPVLNQGRIFHTASLLNDGSVIIAGGSTDPLLAQGRGTALDTVELFRQGHITQLPPMSTGRTRHTASVMADGTLLVAGGMDAQGHALSSVERYDPVNQTWHTVASMQQPRFDHTATVLEDGRVMVIGGVDEQGQPLDSVEIFDPATGQWSAGPTLPQWVRTHSAIRLKNGDVVVAGGAVGLHAAPEPWLYVLANGADHWMPAGLMFTRRDPEFRPVMSADDTGLTIFSAWHIYHWQPTGMAAPHTAPLWANRPIMTALSDNRVLVTGPIVGQNTNWQSFIYDPARHTWSFAGYLNFPAGETGRAITLTSGNVLLAARSGPVDPATGQQNLACGIWSPQTASWQGCGTIVLHHSAHDGIPGLQQLSDGRVVLVADMHEVYVYDQDTWTPHDMTWQTTGLHNGTSVRPQVPLAVISDTPGGQTIDIGEAASQFWGTIDTGAAKDMFWDVRRQVWAYIYDSGYMDGPRARLPDGCILSMSLQFKLFDPASGTVRTLPNLAQNVDMSASDMLVLADGTVIASGVSNGGSELGGGFFARKASCSGFAPDPQDARLIFPAWASAEPPQAARSVPPKPTAHPEWYEEFSQFWMRWKIPLAFLAIALALLMIRLLMMRWTGWAERHSEPGSILALLTREFPETRNPLYRAARILLLVVSLLLLFLIATRVHAF